MSVRKNVRRYVTTSSNEQLNLRSLGVQQNHHSFPKGQLVVTVDWLIGVAYETPWSISVICPGKNGHKLLWLEEDQKDGSGMEVPVPEYLDNLFQFVKLSGEKSALGEQSVLSEVKTRTEEEVFKLKHNFGTKTNRYKKFYLRKEKAVSKSHIREFEVALQRRGEQGKRHLTNFRRKDI